MPSGLLQGQNNAAVANRTLNPQMLRERYTQISNSLRDLEKNEILLSRSGKSEAMIRQERDGIHKEITSRRQMLQKIGGMLQTLSRQAGPGNQ